MLTSAVAVRRDALLLEPFDDFLSTANDWDLWIRLLMRGRFALAGRVTAGYRRHGGAVSMNTDARKRNRHRIVAKHAGASWVSMLEAYVELHDMRAALAAGRTTKADVQLANACRRYPAITQDLQWWAFFESFRAHDRPDAISRWRFWQALQACAHVCANRALPLDWIGRWLALAEGVDAASSYARLAGLRPEAIALRWLARLRRLGFKPPRPAPESDPIERRPRGDVESLPVGFAEGQIGRLLRQLDLARRLAQGANALTPLQGRDPGFPRRRPAFRPAAPPGRRGVRRSKPPPSSTSNARTWPRSVSAIEHRFVRRKREPVGFVEVVQQEARLARRCCWPRRFDPEDPPEVQLARPGRTP
jgi:hypothetical protein